MLRALLAALFWWSSSLTGQDRQKVPSDLTEAALEDLMDIQVTTVSKREQRILQTPAAVYVITQEDIRRSGATSIAEVLRLVPGLQVARLSAHKWAISSRGFNGRFSNKLLVMMDGRTLYSTLFAGVEWDTQDTMLEDIDRIEVIRGPGATMWGANAVNGVINIITRHASETKGGIVTAGAGDHERGFGAFRYGSQLSPNAYIRGYAKYFQRSQLRDSGGKPGGDDWSAQRGGFRLDWIASRRDALTLQGDLYRTGMDERRTISLLTPPFTRTFDDEETTSGENVMARWKRRLSGSSDFSLQFYFDRFERDRFNLGQARNTMDFDFQHRLVPSDSHEILWGAGYRRSADDFRNTFQVSFDPASRADNLLTAFLQDELTLVPARLKLTLGSKLEHNDYTGLEVQPAVRLLWTPHRRHSAWAAASRAVATPARTDHDMRLIISVFPTGPGRPLGVVALLGNPRVGSSRLTAFEMGYRTQLSRRLWVDLTAFHNRYGNLRAFEPGEPFLEQDPSPAHVVNPLRFVSGVGGETVGAETLVHWSVTRAWRLSGSHTWLRINLLKHESSPGVSDEGSSPRHQGQIRSTLDLPRRFELDTTLYAVGALPAQSVAAYTRLDARLGWRGRAGFELSMVLQNLLNRRYTEFVVDGRNTQMVVGRSIYGKITSRF